MHIERLSLQKIRVILFLVIAFVTLCSEATTTYGWVQLNHGWHSRHTGVVSESDTSCGIGMVREEFVILDVETNQRVTTGYGNAEMAVINRNTGTVVSSDIVGDGILGPVCYNPDTDIIDIYVEGGLAYNYYDFYASIGWSNPAGVPRNKYVQSTVWIRKNNSAILSYMQAFPRLSWVKVDPEYRIDLNEIPPYFDATRTSRVELFVDAYNPETSALGPTVVSRAFANSSGVGTITLPPQSIPEGYYIWGFYLVLNGSHAGVGSEIITNTPTSGLGWSDLYSFFAYDKTAPTITELAIMPSDTPYPTDNVLITAQATDALLGIESMKIYIDNVLHTSCNYVYKESATCGAEAGTFEAGSYHTYFAVATDGIGNTSTSSINDFVVQNPLVVSDIDVAVSSLNPSRDKIVSDKIGILFEGRVTNLSSLDIDEAGSAVLQIDSNNDNDPDMTYNAYEPLLGLLGVEESKDLSYRLSNVQPGDYSYRFGVDLEGVLGESNTANNTTEWSPFRVIGGTLNASSVEIRAGTTTDISWSTQNASGLECKVSGDSIPISGESGSVTTSALMNSTLFTLSCLDLDNNPIILASEMVSVGVTPKLTIRPRVVHPGGSVTISWDTHNSDEQACELLSSPLAQDLLTQNIDDPSKGSIEVPVTARMTYILTCPHISSVLYNIATVEIVSQVYEN